MSGARNFVIKMFRHESFGRKIVLCNPESLPGWGNAVEIVRWVVGQYTNGGRWSDYVLIPEQKGDDGVWSVRDWSGRLTEIRDMDFI